MKQQYNMLQDKYNAETETLSLKLENLETNTEKRTKQYETVTKKVSELEVINTEIAKKCYQLEMENEALHGNFVDNDELKEHIEELSRNLDAVNFHNNVNNFTYLEIFFLLFCFFFVE